MSDRGFFGRLMAAMSGVRLGRLMILLLLPLALGLAADWLRDDRVVFPAPLPKFTTVPPSP